MSKNFQPNQQEIYRFIEKSGYIRILIGVIIVPQPATHYLVMRRAIPREYWISWWDQYKPYFGLGSSAPDLFYFPLMPKSIPINSDIAWDATANLLHSCRSYDMFCLLLAKAKQYKRVNGLDAEKQFSFAIGYYCHVITDCIFHPYVYRSSGDHWSTSDFSHELLHKAQELAIDNGVFRRYYNKSQNFAHIQWQCNDPADEKLLEIAIASLLHESLQEIYPDCYPVSVEVNNPEHPIQQAYSALIQSITTLFEGTEVHLFGMRLTLNSSDIRLKLYSNFFFSPYPNCPTLDSYTPEELFNFSSVASRKVFITALGFWESDIASAKEYFQVHPAQAHYLNSGNWNLDTGLPCQYNNYRQMRDESTAHYAFKCNELKAIYRILKAEFNPADF